MNGPGDVSAIFRTFSQAHLVQIGLIVFGAWLLITLSTRLLPLLANRVSGRFRFYLLASVPVLRLLVIIGALVLIYVFNFKALPLEKAPIDTIYLQNLLSFLNVGLAAFVLIAIAGRFAYPAVSNENEAFWLVKSGPLTIRGFLWIKFFIYMIPLLILTEILIVATNIFLNVTTFMMVLSTITIFCMVPGVVAIGIGFGAAYPNFKAENPAQTVTSFGGLVFMVVSAAFVGGVIILEAGPVYNLFMAGYKNRALALWEWGWIAGSFTAVFIVCVLAVLLPMQFGEKQLHEKGI